MKILKSFVVPVLGAFLLTGCANQKDAAPMGEAELCIMMGEPVESDGPSSDYMGKTYTFCCDKCKTKWDGMDDAGRNAKIAEKK